MDISLVGLSGLLFRLLLWGLPLVLLVWFIRTRTAIANSLRDIADRLSALERAVRDDRVARHLTNAEADKGSLSIGARCARTLI